MPAIADDPVKTLAFDKIQNVFIAIIAGIIGASCYNRFKNAKLPDWLAFFSGKRCVAIVTGLVSIAVSVVLLFVWPVIFSALVAVGEGIIGMDGIGAGIYAFLNRLLIPTGLHPVSYTHLDVYKRQDQHRTIFVILINQLAELLDTEFQPFLQRFLVAGNVLLEQNKIITP